MPDTYRRLLSSGTLTHYEVLRSCAWGSDDQDGKPREIALVRVVFPSSNYAYYVIGWFTTTAGFGGRMVRQPDLFLCHPTYPTEESAAVAWDAILCWGHDHAHRHRLVGAGEDVNEVYRVVGSETETYEVLRSHYFCEGDFEIVLLRARDEIGPPYPQMGYIEMERGFGGRLIRESKIHLTEIYGSEDEANRVFDTMLAASCVLWGKQVVLVQKVEPQ